MRVNWSYIKMIFLLSLVVFLFAFSSSKNKQRAITKPQVKFIGDNNLFITNETVSKLLIQNSKGAKNVHKETLVLNELENALKSNPMIKAAEVYVAVNGILSAEIEQKTPIARVSTNASYYIDDEGLYMPLSNNYSVRVPLVTGYIEKNNLKNVYKVALKISEDNFLKKNVIEIHQSANKKIHLKLRQCKFLVQLGHVSFLDKKINNLKAFYKKSQKEKTLNNYSKVNLQFENQVVCTKI
ncbi:cell division protein FtsQ/DivIB [Sabulilitoribacter arenilitoris]|uniref:Cell division protein FtsQ/DivIB n=2 Tax=Wocania arenilitoris TaxID=2044858 RepID=A0AAE3ELM7_9FLAO|nr:cell division protein FtsQ/DivIB [Wocania arenilitoris]MCF7567628.1 cell division protein FtsQ/DivIB [Wocania arenilitoris]